jgi:hypothetical protein
MRAFLFMEAAFIAGWAVLVAPAWLLGVRDDPLAVVALAGVLLGGFAWLAWAWRREA